MSETERLATLEQWAKSHEKVCTEGRIQNTSEHKELSELIKGVSARMWLILISVAGGALFVIIDKLVKS